MNPIKFWQFNNSATNKKQKTKGKQKMNSYNKFNNQQNSEESTLAETILLAGSGLFLIWVGAVTLPVMSVLGFIMIGTALMD